MLMLLPRELLTHVFKYLNFPDLLALACVSRQIAEIANCEEVWQHRLTQDFSRLTTTQLSNSRQSYLHFFQMTTNDCSPKARIYALKKLGIYGLTWTQMHQYHDLVFTQSAVDQILKSMQQENLSYEQARDYYATMGQRTAWLLYYHNCLLNADYPLSEVRSLTSCQAMALDLFLNDRMTLDIVKKLNFSTSLQVEAMAYFFFIEKVSDFQTAFEQAKKLDDLDLFTYATAWKKSTPLTKPESSSTCCLL